MIPVCIGPGRGALQMPEAVLLLTESGHEIEVYLDGGARSFVGPAAFYGTEVSAVSVEPREPGPDPAAVVFAPADAAMISRLAHGFGDGPAYRAYASGIRPAVVAPELDPDTASHPAVRNNLDLLRDDGCTVLDGGAGASEISAAVLHGIGGFLNGVRVVVTAGGTREPVDSVRFVGNSSSGKMGAALAREAHRAGAEVSVVAANVPEVEPGVNWHAVQTFAQLRAQTLELCQETDVLIMAAAVSDFTPASPLTDQKIRRSGRETMTLELAATHDVLAEVRERYPRLFVAGFAATHGDPLADAREKLERKGVDLVVGNDISAPGIGFGSEENEAYIVIKNGSGSGYEEHFVPRGPKTALASVILRHLMPAIKHMEV